METANTPVKFDIYEGNQLVRTEILAEQTIKIGKLSSSHVRIDDDSVSRMHAVVEVAGPDDVVILDLGSTTGTFVNGERVTKQRLRTGDRIRLGAVTVVGHSMGGMLATRFALLFPERTLRLVLVNPIGLEAWKRVVPYTPVDAWFAAELKKTPEQIRDYMKASYFDGKWSPAYDQLAALHQQFVHRRVNGVDLTTDLLDTDASPCHDFARYHPLSRPRRGGVENAGYSYGREVAKSKKTLTLLGSDT